MEEALERTRIGSLFRRHATVEAGGVVFKLRRMSLKEELEWIARREAILADQSKTREEKVVDIWGDLLKRVVEEPRLEDPVEELPATVVSALLAEIEKLHLWDLPLAHSQRASR